jgi:hypothetical protein
LFAAGPVRGGNPNRWRARRWEQSAGWPESGTESAARILQGKMQQSTEIESGGSILIMITNEQGRPLTPEEAESVALGLEKKGLIYRTGEQRLGRDGKMWDVWALNADGLNL